MQQLCELLHLGSMSQSVFSLIVNWWCSLICWVNILLLFVLDHL